VNQLMLPTRDRLYIPPFMLDGEARGGRVRGARSLIADQMLRKQLGFLVGIGGGSQPLGFHTEGDVIRTTVNGVDLNVLWREFTAALDLLNRQRQPLVDLLTYTVTENVATVPQVGSSANFEKASEFGIPVAVRTGVGYFQMGFAFDWYDTGARYTWKYLAEASDEQIRSVFDTILEGDNRLVFTEVMRSLFRNTNRTAEIEGQNYTVYAFYNNDGTVPPTYKTNTFLGTHQHYRTSGAATVNSGDLEEMLDDLEAHGYSAANGYSLVFLTNKAEVNTIRTFKSVQNGGTARFDFIPALGTPNFLLPDNFRVNTEAGGTRPASTYRGIAVAGAYGDAIILVDDFMPAGYMALFATGGPDNVQNPIGIREHIRPELRGLRMIKGRSPDYPLQDSYWQRGFGTGIRHRGAGMVMQITAGAYTIPAQYV
jgi:hypothetical protein